MEVAGNLASHSRTKYPLVARTLFNVWFRPSLVLMRFVSPKSETLAFKLSCRSMFFGLISQWIMKSLHSPRKQKIPLTVSKVILSHVCQSNFLACSEDSKRKVSKELFFMNSYTKNLCHASEKNLVSLTRFRWWVLLIVGTSMRNWLSPCSIPSSFLTPTKILLWNVPLYIVPKLHKLHSLLNYLLIVEDICNKIEL